MNDPKFERKKRSKRKPRKLSSVGAWVGTQIKELRISKGMTQAELASIVQEEFVGLKVNQDGLSIKQNRISKIEHGSSITAPELFAIARALEVDVKHFDFWING